MPSGPPKAGAFVPGVLSCYLLILLTAAGCIERKETFKVAPDGGVQIQAVFKGDADDFDGGDALPEDGGDWNVVESREEQHDGTIEVTRVASLNVPAGGQIPDQYCPADSEQALSALQTPTIVTVEKRPDGTYYHFKRVYQSRRWAVVNYFRESLLEGELESMEGKDFAKLKGGEQRELAETLLQFERQKTIALAEQAAGKMQPPLDQAEWLDIHAAIGEIYGRISPDRVIEILTMTDKAAADEATAHEVENVFDQISVRVERILDASPGPVRSTVFLNHFDLARDRYAVTEDLQDEAWKVSVELPGKIVGHNGDKIEDGAIQWEFDGAALNDRNQIVMATSVVR